MQAAMKKQNKQRKKAFGVHFSTFLLFSFLGIIRLQSGLWGVAAHVSVIQKEKQKLVVLLQNFLPVRRLRLLSQRCFIVALHQARCTSADLVLPWHSSTAKSIYKDFAPSRYPTAPPHSFKNQLASAVLGALPSCSVCGDES